MYACGVSGVANAPDVHNVSEYALEIDGANYYLQIPSGADVGGFNRLKIETADIDQNLLRLFAFGYDVSRDYYGATNFSLGLTRVGCCSVSDVLDFERQRRGKQFELITMQVDKIILVRIAGMDNGGGYFARYYLPYNDRFMFYLDLLVFRRHASDGSFVSSRLEILDDIAARFARLNGLSWD